MKRLPEKINSRDELVKKFKKNYDVTKALVEECETCKAITPSGGKTGPGRTGRYIYTKEHMVIIIACVALWEMGIYKKERDQLLSKCSLKDIKEIQRIIKDSSYLKILDFLKSKKVKLEYEREGLREFLDFEIH